MLACAQPVSWKRQAKQMTNATNPCEATTPSLSPAAQRLRSTLKYTAYWLPLKTAILNLNLAIPLVKNKLGLCGGEY